MGRVFHGDDWPHLLDYAFVPVALAIAALDALALKAMLEPSDMPFAAYDANLGIRAIYMLAIVAELALAVGVVAWALDRTRKVAWEATVVAAAFVAAAMPWVELWWGSVFYYGEVRDKQGLPWGVIHFGPIGTTVFAWYLLSRIKLPASSELVRILARGGLLVSVWPAQMYLLDALEKPLELWQS